MSEPSVVHAQRQSPPVRRPTLHPRLRMEIVEGEAIVLDREGERVHHLNEVATLVLECCTGDHTEDEIVAEVLARYDVDPAEAAADVAELIERFRALGLLV